MQQPVTESGKFYYIKKYQSQILSLLLALYALPVGFFYSVSDSLDSSWVRAINIAVKNNWRFGTDFVFTYGPLGYLTPRNSQYISDIYFLFADIFTTFCFYYIINRILSKEIKWFFLILIAIFYFKGTEYASYTFMFFILFTVLNLRNNFSNTVEIALCAISGVVVFFVKANYGIVSYPIIFCIMLYLLYRRNFKALGAFSVICILLFSVIFLKVNIDILNYVRNSIYIIQGYNEAMQLAIDPNCHPFICVIVYFFLFLSLLVVYFIEKKREGQILVPLITSGLIMLMFFLSYKNGFTRNDAHNDGFFVLIPLFLIFTISLLDSKRTVLMRVLCVAVILLSDSNVDLPHGCEGKGFVRNNLINYTSNYFKTMFTKQEDILKIGPGLKIPDSTLRIIGRSTVDITPIDITTLQVNNMNYYPRPVIQSYSAYSGPLDSINARHFFKDNRPEYVMASISSIDNRMVAWDESITKTMFHLNYDYAGFVSLSSDTVLTNGHGNYLLLKSNKQKGKYPVLDKLDEKIVKFNDTLHINFPPDQVIYVSIDIQYSLLGKIKNVIYNPTIMTADLFFDDACKASITHRMVRPIAKEPVLINKAICMNTDFVNFVTGELKKNTDVKAIAFHAESLGDVKPEIKLTFYKFSNYKSK